MRSRSLVSRCLVGALALLPAGAGAQAPPPNVAPPSLKTVPVLRDPRLNEIVGDFAAAARPGKALFWDMRVGSDGVTACASCHFDQGADDRVRGQLHPGPDGAYQSGGPNAALTVADFPFMKLLDPQVAGWNGGTVLADRDEVLGSSGVLPFDFVAGPRGAAADRGTLVVDPLHAVGGVPTRRMTGRNTPSVINAVFNFENFSDGRASRLFNGVNPFGAADPDARVVVANGAALAHERLLLDFSSLASQAVGPPINGTEMSFSGRTWPDIGRRLLALRPLGRQRVHPQDSLLGGLSRAVLAGSAAPGYAGLKTATYAAMVRTAFNRRYWGSTRAVRIAADGTRTFLNRPARPLARDEYTQMEANFSLFFGLAVQLYEGTLVADDTRFDRFQDGDAGALTAQEQRGLEVFVNAGRCVLCHAGAELTSASTTLALNRVVFEPLPEVPALLDGASVVPPAATTASGLGQVALLPALGLLETRVDFSGIDVDDVVRVTIHLGAPGVNGPAILTMYERGVDPLPDRPRIRPVLTIGDLAPAGTIDTLEEAMTELANGRGYLLIATGDFPDGEIRGNFANVPEGAIELMAMSFGTAFYDVGYYNLGLRPTADDVGRGGTSPGGLPLSFSRQAVLKKNGLLPPDLVPYAFDLPPGQASPPDRVAVDGAFKTPGLRNVELTGPYFHNGGMATLRQVVDFYVRGGDFAPENVENLNPLIEPLGALKGDAQAQTDLIAFLLALTDERVRWERAPFDHPQLFLFDGQQGDDAAIPGDFTAFQPAPRRGFRTTERVRILPPVGALGRPPALGPARPFLDADPFAR